jgi:hypothetical protein
VGFEATIPAFGPMKTVHALDVAATVIGRIKEHILKRKNALVCFIELNYVFCFLKEDISMNNLVAFASSSGEMYFKFHLI